MEAKAWWQSYTLWVNLLAVVGVMLVNSLQLLDTARWAELSAGILALLNVILRLKTDAPIQGGAAK